MFETLTAVLEAPSAPAYNDEAYTGETWGCFRLLEKVGQGSFGEVYRAFDTTLEREVALKLLLPRLYDKGDDEKAILREARLIARVRHPNVVAVYGVDRFNGRVGFWSDFVHGQTLSSLQAAQGRFGAHETTQIGIDICRAAFKLPAETGIPDAVFAMLEQRSQRLFNPVVRGRSENYPPAGETQIVRIPDVPDHAAVRILLALLQFEIVPQIGIALIPGRGYEDVDGGIVETLE